MLLLTAGLLPAVEAILDGEAFSQLSLRKQLTRGLGVYADKTVGAGLPAIAVCQPTSLMALTPSSQASQLPHLGMVAARLSG
ncbi:hypothetical protein CER19_22685 [Pseudomonas sp. GL93]|nr:hypothetical protein CER19_22685 [Pseudomonas sp. GL93]